MSKIYSIPSVMTPDQTGEVSGLIGRAMNPDEGRWAETTFRRHFDLAARGVADGRHYLVSREGSRLTGIVGLHHYEWGPPENVWLGWFAVEPECQGRGLGSSLMASICEHARSLGFRKLFIETYSSPAFDKARAFYARQGFARVGGISAYLPDGADMVVFSKSLA